MLDKQDIVILQKMFDQHGQDIKADVRDEIRSSISASEKRMISHMDEMKKEIVTEFSDLLDSSVLPQIAELQTDMAVVKQHLKLA